MANQKISALPALDSIPEGAYVPVVKDGKVYRAPAKGVGIARGVRYDRVDANGYPLEVTLLTTDGKVLPRQFYSVNATYPFYNTEKINIPDDIVSVGTYAFRYCTGITEIHLPLAQSIASFAYAGCRNLAAIDLPSATTVAGNAFSSCKALKSAILPQVTELTENSTFSSCTALENVQLGSVGHPVSALAANTFASCTQTGLTITVYTTGGAELANAPWGATNAMIIYKEA